MTFRIEHVAAGYGDARVVRDVSLEVRGGSVTAMLGRNGAGKTTTLMAAAGVVATTAGRVLLDDEDITRVRAARRPGMGLSLVQEGKRIFRRLSVEDNLAMGAYSVGRGGDLNGRREEIFAMFPALDAKRRAQASSLSGGQQQMLAIGQALMANPRYLMLDEPSAGLAPAIVSEIFDLIDALRTQGLGILLVEQSVEFALGIADDVTVVDLGRDVLRCSPRDFDARARIADAYLNRMPDVAASGGVAASYDREIAQEVPRP